MLRYEEIIDYIKSQISSGSLHNKMKLPSVRSVSKQFNCSIGTVLIAYEKLEKDHIIYSSPKSGYYVLDNLYNFSNNENSIIDFSSGTPDVETFPYRNFQHCLNKSIDLYKDTLFSYSDPKGLKSLISVLLKHLQQYQIFTKSDNVVVTSSSQQALNILSVMPFPNGKSNVLVEQPTYCGMIKSLEHSNTPTLGIERGLNGINIDELEKLFKYGNVKFFYTIPRFHNPTGNSFTKHEKECIVKLAQKYNVYIVEDDITVDLDVDTKNDPMFSFDTFDKVIYLKSYSKILMPGLRVAALILPDLLIDTFLEYKKWTDMNSPILSQGALEMYLKNGMFDIQKKEVIKLYTERLQCLRHTLGTLSHPGIVWNIPTSGYFACIYAENSLNTNVIVNSLKEKNIELLDTSLCFLKEYKNYNYFRISISRTNNDKIKKGIPLIINAIEKNIL